MRYVLIFLTMLFMAGCANQVTVRAPQSLSTAVVTPQQPIVAPVAKVATAPPTELTAVVSPSPKDLDLEQVNCLSDAIYYEARGENEKGQAGVGYVVMNRVHSKKWPDTVCKVVYQCSHIKHHGRQSKQKVCQFGWASKKHRVNDAKAYAHAQDLARLVMLGFVHNPVGHCTYFHSTAERTLRGSRYALRIRIEHHLFYAYKDELASI